MAAFYTSVHNWHVATLAQQYYASDKQELSQDLVKLEQYD